MDKSRGFRHELVLRVSRAKFGTEPFIPFCNATNDLRICVQCGQMAPKMKRCTGCKRARYCDRECQKANWLTHRSECCPDRCLPAGIRTIPYPILAQAASRLIGPCLSEFTVGWLPPNGDQHEIAAGWLPPDGYQQFTRFRLPDGFVSQAGVDS